MFDCPCGEKVPYEKWQEHVLVCQFWNDEKWKDMRK